jgi:hypothetical protein
MQDYWQGPVAMSADADVLERVAVTVACEDSSVTSNATETKFSGTITVEGMAAPGSLEESAIGSPPAGAGMSSDTISSIVPPQVAAGLTTSRLWSAGCSSGATTLTVAESVAVPKLAVSCTPGDALCPVRMTGTSF